MGSGLVAVPAPPAGVYRLRHASAGWFAPPDWQYVHDDGTFGNRFDDPSAADGVPQEGRFRTIYCATQRAAVFGETIAHFRPSLSLLAALTEIEDDESLEASLAGAADPNDVRRGLIPADWRIRRRVDHTVLDPGLAFVDLGAAETIEHLRRALAPVAIRLGLSDVDLSVVTGQQRTFTQYCARYVYTQFDPAGTPRFAGIRYVSRLNAAWECWAVFADRIRHLRGPGFPATIFPDDPDLVEAARLFGLSIEIFAGHYLRP